jgi:hypothetical protein
MSTVPTPTPTANADAIAALKTAVHGVLTTLAAEVKAKVDIDLPKTQAAIDAFLAKL